jgi:hypothetical protein
MANLTAPDAIQALLDKKIITITRPGCLKESIMLTGSRISRLESGQWMPVGLDLADLLTSSIEDD